MLGHKCEHVYEMALEMTRKYSSPAESRLLELAGLAFLRLNLTPHAREKAPTGHFERV